jgi:hypothetical protein
VHRVTHSSPDCIVYKGGQGHGYPASKDTQHCTIEAGWTGQLMKLLPITTLIWEKLKELTAGHFPCKLLDCSLLNHFSKFYQ